MDLPCMFWDPESTGTRRRVDVLEMIWGLIVFHWAVASA